MKTYEYRLNNENYKELNSYMAAHDKSVYKKLLSLIISLSVISVILTFLFLQINRNSIVISIILVILIVFIFPRIFWRIVFKRIDKIVDSNKLLYSKVRLYIDDFIRVEDDKNKIRIDYKNIEKIDFTKNNCIIFYHFDNKLTSLIIPNLIFTDEELKEFYLDIEKRVNDAKK